MPWFPDPAGGPPIQAPTNPNPAGGSLGYYSDPSYNGPPPSGASGGGGGGGGGAGGVQPPQATVNAASQLGAGINSLLGAIASGNKQAFDEAVRQFNQTFGLDQSKFNESVRQFNQNFAVTQAGLTGTYQGAPTQQALAQAYNQQLGAITTAAGLQANPFRQQQVLGQLGPILTGVGGVAGFSAPNTVQGVGTQGGTGPNTGLAYMQQLIEDIRNPGANQASVQGVLNAIPTPNKLNSQDFLRAAPSTQQMILQGMQEKYGLDPNDSLAQIKNTLPTAAFQSPQTTPFGQIKG